MTPTMRLSAAVLAFAIVIASALTIVLLQTVPAAAQTAHAAVDPGVAQWAVMAAAIAAGLSTLAAGYAVASVGSAAVGALAVLIPRRKPYP